MTSNSAIKKFKIAFCEKFNTSFRMILKRKGLFKIRVRFIHFLINLQTFKTC